MPSKQWQKKQKDQKYYKENEQLKKEQARQCYVKNAESVKNRNAQRMTRDEKLRRENKLRVKRRLQEDNSYMERNKEAARLNQQARQREERDRITQKNRMCQTIRLQDHKKRLQHNEANSKSQKKRLVNNNRRQNHQLVNCFAQKRRLQDDTARKKHQSLLRTAQKCRLEDEAARKNHQSRNCAAQRCRLEDEAVKKKHQTANLKYQTARLDRNEECRQKNRLVAKQNTVKRLQTDKNYSRTNKIRAYKRSVEVRKQHHYRSKNRIRMFLSRHRDDTPGEIKYSKLSRKTERPLLTSRQKYWMRRTRLIAKAREQKLILAKQRSLAIRSDANILDVQLLFSKAQQRVRKSRFKISTLHSHLSSTAADCLQHIPDVSNPTELDLNSAFGELRVHNASGEPYYWEVGYNLLTATQEPVMIDNLGRLHVFKPVVIKTAVSANEGQIMTEHTIEQCEQADVPVAHTKNWQCHPEICRITSDEINGTVKLLQGIATTECKTCEKFYLQVDKCGCQTLATRMGHSPHCSLSDGCQSLLRPARTLSCHYTQLRSLVRRLYEIRQLVHSLDALIHTMSTGTITELDSAIAGLDDIFNRLSSANSKKCEDNENAPSQCFTIAEEDKVMQKHGTKLRKVAQLRDTYNTLSCDFCEQLRSDLEPLKSYENRRGFDSGKMESAIDLLYQHKTKYESIDKFLETTFICRYCADKLKSNKDVARAAFNCLNVVPTPACLQDLNIFERILIKFTMTCLTVVRLGQVSNKGRPSNELTPALKGRVVYLPVDVGANASFMPDDLLNVNNLLLLVGGQPTRQKTVWTSVIDLQKVHKALCWLKDNNQLYKDIPAYTANDIEQIIAKRLQGIASPCNTNAADTALLKKLDVASKSFLYENFSVQPINTAYPQDMLVDYQLSKVHGESGDVFDTDLDLKAFPELFPTGENGMRDARRTTKIGSSDYIKSRLLNKDPKFRLNMTYIFHCFQTQEITNMCHSVAHMLRTVTGKTLTAKAFSDRLNNRDGEMQNNLFGLMANIRGSKEYFARLAMNIRWMIKTLGPPTLFITCSTAEWFSQPFIDHLREINKSVVTTENMTPAELCSIDPVSVSKHFHKKWSAIFNNLIKPKDGIFGHVTDYFWRIEYQARGAPHVHCVLWVGDAPILGKDSADKVKQYIQSIITCSRPDPSISPTLSHLVSRFQEHKCNRYCMKSYKRNGKFYKKCRFGFPRPTKKEFHLNDVIDCLTISKSNQPRKRLYHLQRCQEEIRINDYNPALLMANEANVDIQYIGHIGSRLPYYITSYMTKHERSEQDDMWRDIFSSTKSLGTNAMSFMLKSMKSRQVGANEACDRLLGHKLFSSSRQVRFADLQPPHKTKRVLKPAAEIKRLIEINPDSEDIFQPHWVLDVYPDRPDELESSSLYNLLSWYEREFVPNNSNCHLKLKTMNMCLRRRHSKPYIVTHQVVNPNRGEDNKEVYFYYLLKLFKPWRKEEDIKLDGCTYSESYSVFKDSLPEMVNYHERNLQLAKQDQEEEVAIRNRAQQLSENEISEDHEEGAMEGCISDHMQTAMQELVDAHQRTLRRGDEDLQSAYDSLNTDQKRVVDTVMSKVRQGNDPIRMFVSGQGGTGKSRIIDVIDRLMSLEYGRMSAVPVAVAAPTGLAAFSINGTTIHRILSLPVEHGKPADYSSLNSDQLTIVRATLRGLKMLIIDEISMVSSLTMMYIHLRLGEIMANNDLFGGINILIFADLLQLPPVKGSQPFIPVTFLEAKQRLGSIASMDIWQAFHYDELTINMRQSSDKDYSDLLSTVRVGSITDHQYTMLTGRLISHDRRATVQEISDRYQDLVSHGESPLILMATTALCHEVNSEMLKTTGNEIYTIMAIDTLDTAISKLMLPKVQTAYKKLDEDVTRTAGLEKTLQLCVNARVMLKRNLEVEAGLVNGAVGSILSFTTAEVGNQGQVNRITVKFDKIKHPVIIERESSSFEVLKSIYYTRRQFPLMTAFAITIHKSQGLSLHSAIVDVGTATFGPGMTYVALSRVTSLQGLHLIDIDRHKIGCDQKAIVEYNRLRRIYTPHLGDLPVPSSTNKRLAVVENVIPSDAKQRKSQKRTKHNTRTNSESASISSPTQTDKPDQEDDIFQFCNLQSLGVHFQQQTCDRMNLIFDGNELSTTPRGEHQVAKKLQTAIYNRTQKTTKVKIFQIGADGNCLFRALSLAVTGTQQQHGLIRSYIVNHMRDSHIRTNMEVLFHHNRQNDSYENYLVKMENSGEWGTEEELVAAANLFNVSILCYSRYSRQVALQHFSPHFTLQQQCNTSCNHETIFLVNTSATHYNMATVVINVNNEE